MSFLFSGLLRLNVQPTVRFDCEEVSLQEPFVLKSGQLNVRYAQPPVGEHGNEFWMFTNNQNFIANSQKKYFLENIIHFIPKIVYWFKPNYAVQIATRYSVKMMSGETDSQSISAIIGSNEGLAKYFENFLVIVERVYTCHWLNNIMVNEQFSCLLIGSLM